MTVDLDDVAFERGSYVLVRDALRTTDRVRVIGRHPDLQGTLAAWCRVTGHGYESGTVVRLSGRDRFVGALASGAVDPRMADGVAQQADNRWGLAARGALIEDGEAELQFPLTDKHVVWDDDAPRLYAQAVAAQWDPNTAVPWDAEFSLPAQVEQAYTLSAPRVLPRG